jgi:carbonic anhydrase/acetyltransferase-like protein (isoleucine patch superfamily)
MIFTFGDRHLETVGDDYYVAPGAQVVGSVRLGRWASVWFNCVLRGDTDWIIVGDGSNVQDGSVVHTDEGVVVTIGRDVSVGHAVLLHGCTIGDESLIGNGARVLDGVRIGRQCLIAAGSLIPPNKEIPDRSVVMGAPGKVVRQVTDEDLAMMAYAAHHYRTMIVRYRREIPIDSASR